MNPSIHTIFAGGLVCPLDKNNVDTDQIIPKQFLTSVSRDGFADALFFDWRYLSDGSPNPEFVLNAPQYQGASILLSRANFGCGSSREHAPWALQQYGFQVIIAESFADIFYNNSANNGMLLIALSKGNIDSLFNRCSEGPQQWQIDLKNQEIRFGNNAALGFDIDQDVKQRLLSGLDFIGSSEQLAPKISDFEQSRKNNLPWLG
ncbi:3-isopropylmalate dehydratase small subunit [Alkalimonas collagenimarina]|uniref:3-isopropylmalate dehydratase small subunit n=1 Tax=Alkalimonas collagenimarina TaxID=400390 RepID=A0ABT9H0F0_9GAMM|nr:3-isopropylmalate dehydratase small subunit [Alkalimonas collagenimarina]MDP4536559.1 3-isopropylmalate dehydratase small subunit [Alkalimonas collagenimarina]